MVLTLPDTAELRAISKAARRLRDAGHQVMLVGGAVRDLLLSRPPSDFDLVTTARPELLREMFPGYQFTGKSFGVGLLKLDAGTFEIATARLERKYMDGRHPGEIKFSDSLEEDVIRRDFTVNAILCDPLSGEIVDPAGGVEDCFRGIIRTVGDPERRFREDYLRMLRAVRFASRLDFDLMPDVARAIERLAPLASSLAAERIREELTLMLLGRNPGNAFRMLHEVGLLKVVLPEVDALAGVAQPPQFHPEGDVFTHTMLMLDAMVYPDLRTAWCVLLHDVGKAVTQSRDETGRIRFFGHEERGAEIATSMMERLRFANDDATAITSAIRNHMRFAAIPEMRPAKLRKIVADPNFPVELELHRLDCRCCHGKMEAFTFLLDLIAAAPEVSVLPSPWVRGADLIAAGFTPSPLFRKVLEECFERQLAGEFADPDAARKFAVNLAETSKS